MKKFLLWINRDIFEMPPQIFLLNYKRLKVFFFDIHASSQFKAQELKLVLDKKAESWANFSRYSLFSEQ